MPNLKLVLSSSIVYLRMFWQAGPICSYKRNWVSYLNVVSCCIMRIIVPFQTWIALCVCVNSLGCGSHKKADLDNNTWLYERFCCWHHLSTYHLHHTSYAEFESRLRIMPAFTSLFPWSMCVHMHFWVCTCNYDIGEFFDVSLIVLDIFFHIENILGLLFYPSFNYSKCFPDYCR